MQKLGKYQLIVEIARGGMGIVYLAATQGPGKFNKLLVVKELKPELVEDHSFLEMFLEEARLAARLSHPNIVQTIEVGVDDRRHYMVMDYLEGRPLNRVLKKKSEKFTQHMHLRVLCEVLQGLQYAHSLTDYDGTPLGVVHRDVTPHNVFITFDGQVKIVDFGIAKAVDSQVETRTGMLKGKPTYMAPEQISGEVDPRVDIFAVGVMLWEAIAGRRLWERRSDVEILAALIRGNLPSLRDAKPDAPEALVRICDRAMAKDRENRYASAAELQADLEAYLAGEGARVSVREIGGVVSDLFAEERKQVRASIEAHLAAARAGLARVSGPLPSLTASHETTGEGSASTPSHAQPDRTISGPATFGDVSMTGGAPPAGDTSVARWLVPTALAVVGVAAITATAVFVGRKPPPPPPVAAIPTATVAAPAPPPAPPEPRKSQITVRASPANATILVNGKAESNPAVRTCEPGDTISLKISAMGFGSKTRDIACTEANEIIDISLDQQPVVVQIPVRERPAPRAAAPPPPPPPEPKADPAPEPKAAKVAPAPASTDVNPAGGKIPHRPIDTTSPYGNP